MSVPPLGWCDYSIGSIKRVLTNGPAGRAGQVLAALRDKGAHGLSGTGQSDVFQRHVKAELATLRSRLEAEHLMFTQSESTAGRDRLASFAIWQLIIEFMDYERPSRLESTTRMKSADVRGTLTFEPHAGGTRMHWSWDVESRHIFKLLTPIIVRIGKRQEETIWGSLERYLEASEAATSKRAPSDVCRARLDY